MSDAVRCCMCGYVYWTRQYENWGTCDHCNYNNDIVPGMMEMIDQGPRLVSSDNIFKFLDGNDNVVDKDKVTHNRSVEVEEPENLAQISGSSHEERLRRVIENE